MMTCYICEESEISIKKNVRLCVQSESERASEWEYKKELLHITHCDSHLHENKLYNNNNTERCKCFRMEMASVRCVRRERCLGEDRKK